MLHISAHQRLGLYWIECLWLTCKRTDCCYSIPTVGPLCSAAARVRLDSLRPRYCDLCRGGSVTHRLAIRPYYVKCYVVSICFFREIKSSRPPLYEITCPIPIVFFSHLFNALACASHGHNPRSRPSAAEKTSPSALEDSTYIDPGLKPLDTDSSNREAMR